MEIFPIDLQQFIKCGGDDAIVRKVIRNVIDGIVRFNVKISKQLSVYNIYRYELN